MNPKKTHLQGAHPTRPASCSAPVFPVGLTRFCSHGNRQWHLLPLAPEPIENALQEVSLETYSPQLFSQKLVPGTSCNQRRLGGGTVANYLGLWFRFETNSHESLWFQTGLIRAIGWIMMDIEGSTWLGPYASFLASVKKKCFFLQHKHTHTHKKTIGPKTTASQMDFLRAELVDFYQSFEQIDSQATWNGKKTISLRYPTITLTTSEIRKYAYRSVEHNHGISLTRYMGSSYHPRVN